MTATAEKTNLLRTTVSCIPALLLAACGGGGGGGEAGNGDGTGSGGGGNGGGPPPAYTVSVTVGTGGNLSPANATVTAGGTTTFTVTASSGYAVSNVTGCGGTLSGTTYTTGGINANCTVTAEFVAQESVTATAGSGGKISPSSQKVNQGGTTTFTVTPGSGYAVSKITGCGGTLSGSTYTTGAISASCTVTASFAATFTWVSGSSASDANGVYGSLGLAASSNVPGGRHSGGSWTDSDGNLWLFGGFGVGAARFNDLWRYTPSSGQWTWVSGANAENAVAVNGTQGVAAAANVPGAGGPGLTWTDASGNLWMFGGYGYDSAGTLGWLSSIWEFSPANGAWTWQGGPTTADVPMAFSFQGGALVPATPGARVTGGGRTPGGNGDAIVLFGGYGYDSTGVLGLLGDLWEYSPSSAQWTFLGGPTTANAAPVYGAQGVAAAANWPGGRDADPIWVDASGNIWLFGGTTNTADALNDLWEYSAASGMWTWMGGSSTADAKGVYGTQGVAADTNMPGARHTSGGWQDASGNLWIFGGRGYDSAGTLGELSDLWMYSPSSRQWTWVAGPNIADAAGVYGAQGTAALTSMPGSRDAPTTWTDSGGNLWLFGGEGYNVTGADATAPEWNDLWRYPTQ